MLRTYMEVARYEFKRSIQHRVNAFFYLSVVLIPPLALFFLWKSILSHGGTIGNYNLSAMITYFVITQFFVMNTPYSAWIEIGDSIKDGTLSLWLTKPLNHYFLYLSRLIGAWLLQWILGVLGVVAVCFMLRTYVMIQRNAWCYVMSILFWFGGIIIGFSYGYILNILSFWLEKSAYLVYFSEGIVALLSGSMIPLDLLPMKQIWLFLPFRFCGYVPAQIWLGRLSLQEVRSEFASMILWALVLVIIANLVFKSGCKRFTASGG